MRSWIFSLTLSLVLIPSLSHALSFNSSFPGLVGIPFPADLRGIIEEAENRWSSWILDDIEITIRYEIILGKDLNTPNALAEAVNIGTSCGPKFQFGNCLGTVSFNLDRLDQLWMDPTPSLDEEFEPTDLYPWFSTNQISPYPGMDALTLALHEIGHVAGFVRSSPMLELFDMNHGEAGSFIAADGTEVTMISTGGHIITGKPDLMGLGLISDDRYSLSPYDIEILSTGYGYTVVPEPGTALLLGAGLTLLTFTHKKE